MVRSRALLGGLMALAIAGTVPQAARAADFYAGKTITFVVGLDAGSGSDLSCRLIAQYIGSHIAGKPTVIVKNMPSTASIAAVNYVGREAKKDGLTLACGPYTPTFQLFHEPGLLVDETKFDIVSGEGEGPMTYMRADTPPGVKTGADLAQVKSQDLILGGFAVDAMKDILSRVFLHALGDSSYKYVTGFTGDPAARAAIQQKFINIYTESMTSWSQVTSQTMGKSGEVVPVAQGGALDSSGNRIRDPRSPDVPTYFEYYTQNFHKPTTGQDWDVAKLILDNVNVALNWLALSPGSPPEALAAMRAAIAPLNADPDFIAASDKLRGKGKFEQPGSLVQTVISHYLDMPKATLDYYTEIVETGKTLAQTQKK